MQRFSIVIVGGGAGGLELAIGLARAGMKDLLLVDRNVAHVWKPRLHELAAGSGRARIDAIPYVALAENWGFAFRQGELDGISPNDRVVILAPFENDAGQTVVPARKFGFKALVLALGGVTPDLGVDGVLQHASMLNDGSDAEALFARLSRRLSGHAAGDDGRTFEIVVAGSGPTGVELSAHLAQGYVCNTLAPASALPQIRVTIIEAADQILSGVEDAVRQQVHDRLTGLGVRIVTGKQVGKVTATEVQVDEDARFPSDLTIWTTGTVGSPVAEHIAALETNKKRQWLVKPTLQSLANDAIFALGDCCAIADDPVPVTAQAASEQADHLIGNLQRYLRGELPEPFVFRNRGTLLSLGQGGSVANIRAWFGDDIFINGNLARAAYRGLYRQHQYRILGAVGGTKDLLSDLLTRGAAPRLKVHG